MDTTSDLTKVDSAISGLSSSPTAEKKMGHRRSSSSASGVFNVMDLGMNPKFGALLPETSENSRGVNRNRLTDE